MAMTTKKTVLDPAVDGNAVQGQAASIVSTTRAAFVPPPGGGTWSFEDGKHVPLDAAAKAVQAEIDQRSAAAAV